MHHHTNLLPSPKPNDHVGWIDTTLRTPPNLTCRVFELLIEECADPTMRRRGAALALALRKELKAMPPEW